MTCTSHHQLEITTSARHVLVNTWPAVEESGCTPSSNIRIDLLVACIIIIIGSAFGLVCRFIVLITVVTARAQNTGQHGFYEGLSQRCYLDHWDSGLEHRW